MKCRGKGDYQDDLDSTTKLKILYRLSVKPYTYGSLWNETRIQRNRLRSLLNNFIELKVVIPHKFKPVDIPVIKIENIIIKPGLVYYILDIDNKQSLLYLRDIRLDAFIKDHLKFNLMDPNLYRRKGKKMNVRSRTFNHDLYDKNVHINKILEQVKLVRKMDYSFSPLLYLPSEQKDVYYKQAEKYSIFTRLKDSDPKLYHKFMEMLRESKMKYNNPSFLQGVKKKSKIEEIGNILSYCKVRNIRKYDILIYLAWCYSSRESYIEIWNTLKMFE